MSKRKSSQCQKRIPARFDDTVCNLGRKLNNDARSNKEVNSIDSDMNTKGVDHAEVEGNTGELHCVGEESNSSGGDNGVKPACGMGNESSSVSTRNALNDKNPCPQPEESTVSQIVVNDVVVNVQANDKASVNDVTNDKTPKTSYADMTKSNTDSFNNKLSHIPTSIIEDGIEVVIFDEDIVTEGSKKWELTACGYFVGYKMYAQEINYLLFRMWGRHRLKSIMDIGNGTFVF